MLQIFKQFGAIGNNIFFVCSAWFLCDSVTKAKKEKIYKIILDAWVISVINLVIYLIFQEKIPLRLIIKSLFPITFENNWYASFYILFYAIHPYINVLLNNLNKNDHFVLSIVSLFLIFILGFVSGHYQSDSSLILFTTEYIFVNYIKKYKLSQCHRQRVNTIVLLSCSLAFITTIIISNSLGNVIPGITKEVVQRMYKNNNPAFFAIGVAAFNIFNNLRIKNNFINLISGLSMYIYLVNDNLLFRSFTRAKILSCTLDNYGKNQYLLITIISSLFLFVFSVVVSLLYFKTISKITKKYQKK